MAKRIGVLEPEQGADETPRGYIKKSWAQQWVRRAEAVWIVHNSIIQRLAGKVREAIREVKASYHYDGPLGSGNALPFSRQSDGSLLHYEIPHAGDIGLWRHFKKKIRVSARPQSHLAASFISRTQQKALRPSLADAFTAQATPLASA